MKRREAHTSIACTILESRDHARDTSPLSNRVCFSNTCTNRWRLDRWDSFDSRLLIRTSLVLNNFQICIILLIDIASFRQKGLKNVNTNTRYRNGKSVRVTKLTGARVFIENRKTTPQRIRTDRYTVCKGCVLVRFNQNLLSRNNRQKVVECSPVV